MQKITHVTLIVGDQQEAADWYVEKLGWHVVADMPFPGDMQGRWLTIAPPGQAEIEVVLQPPEWGPPDGIEERKSRIGKGEGFVIATDDCQGEVAKLAEKGVEITSEPEEMPWGVSAMFVDLYGHAHNLLQPFEME